jgi:hypothetical protein
MYVGLVAYLIGPFVIVVAAMTGIVLSLTQISRSRAAALLTIGACLLLLASCAVAFPVTLLRDEPGVPTLNSPSLLATARALRIVSALLQVAAVIILVIAPFAHHRAPVVASPRVPPANPSSGS